MNVTLLVLAMLMPLAMTHLEASSAPAIQDLWVMESIAAVSSDLCTGLEDGGAARRVGLQWRMRM